jgi:ribonuclease P protein component
LSQGVSILVCTHVQRLKTRPQFQAVLAGKTLARTAHFALHSAALASAEPVEERQLPLFPQQCVWLGAMVPKRWAKRAVTRNAIKRQIYSVSAQFEPQLRVAAHVVRLRAGFDRTHFVSATSDALKSAVRNELLNLFERACSVPLADKG